MDWGVQTLRDVEAPTEGTRVTSNPPLISLIVGSTRPVRVGRQIADQVAAMITASTGAQVQVLDLREIDLPLLDEPKMPILGNYQHAHTLDWAARIAASDAVVFITPQYNGGYPAALKNAVDYLSAEWKSRPAAIISYGGHGGKAAARQLREVLEFIGLALVPATDDVAITIARDGYSDAGVLSDPQSVVAGEAVSLERLADALVGQIAQVRAAA